MKEGMKKGVKLGIGIGGAILLIIVVVLVKNFSPLLSMNPAETGYIAGTNILIFKDGVGTMYLIEVDDEYIIIDAGTNKAEIEKLLAEYEIDPMQAAHVFLTHSDSDHVASLELYENAQIYMSEDELSLLDGTKKRQFFVNNSLSANIALEDIILLEDNQELQIGEHMIQAIKTPGHTIGSMTFILDDQYMFTGDAFKWENGEFAVHPFSMDREQSMESIEKIEQLCESEMTLLTSHYGLLLNR